MSDVPNGPGWWQASDGRWYPPESHPGYRPQAAVPAAPNPYAVPPAPFAAPSAPQLGYVPTSNGPKKSGMPTWAKVLLILGLLLVVFVGGCAVFVGKVVRDAGDSVSKGCGFAPTATIDRALGTKTTVLPLTGLIKIAGIALDNRVLNGASSCMITGSRADNFTGRIARKQSSDAASVFKEEVKKAQGTKVDKGGGLTVESENYYDTKVELGDEAFCTTVGLPPSSGVLVRKGDTLLYVSLSPSNALPGETSCDAAQLLAKAILGI
jgi:hypothetical protein